MASIKTIASIFCPGTIPRHGRWASPSFRKEASEEHNACYRGQPTDIHCSGQISYPVCPARSFTYSIFSTNEAKWLQIAHRYGGHLCTQKPEQNAKLKRGDRMCVAERAGDHIRFLLLLGLELDCFSQPPLQCVCSGGQVLASEMGAEEVCSIVGPRTRSSWSSAPIWERGRATSREDSGFLG